MYVLGTKATLLINFKHSYAEYVQFGTRENAHTWNLRAKVAIFVL